MFVIRSYRAAIVAGLSTPYSSLHVCVLWRVSVRHKLGEKQRTATTIEQQQQEQRVRIDAPGMIRVIHAIWKETTAPR